MLPAQWLHCVFCNVPDPFREVQCSHHRAQRQPTPCAGAAAACAEAQDLAARPIHRLLWGHRWSVWRNLAAYFPVHLHKTAELDPAGNYVFGFHPHGILCLSAWVSFATEACDVSEKCAHSSARLGCHVLNLHNP